MAQTDLKLLANEISMLSVFRGVLSTKPITALIDFLLNEDDSHQKKRLYGEFVYSLAKYSYSFSDFLQKAVFEDENQYIKSVAKNEKVSEILAYNASQELSLFSELTRINSEMLCDFSDYGGYIPQFENDYIDFVAAYNERLQHIERFGYGIFATAKMFRVSGDDIVPVDSADEISLDSFIGYASERKQVFDNTQALIDGKPSANILLCGDAGTGKSSTVKACANHFYNQGVRLIELRKDQLFSLSYVMGKISEQPLKFIIFIDDLSFNKNDDCFSMLKAALEGSASAKSQNAVIYATSNRRHIVKETFSDRDASDDIHRNDTKEELMSLSDRFGLTVYFSKPNKSLYLEIVRELAKRNGLDLNPQELDIKAEAFALSKGSRSPRAAKQFINSLI